MKKKYIPFIVYVILAVILIICMIYLDNMDVYGMAAMEAVARWVVCGIVLLADIFITVVHGIILGILYIRKKKVQV